MAYRRQDTNSITHKMERHAGEFFSFVVVGVLFAVMAVYTVPERKEKPREFEVLVNLTEPDPPEQSEPEPEPEEDPPLTQPVPEQMQEVAATRKDSNEEGEEILDPQPIPEPEVAEPLEISEQPEISDQTDAALADWIPTNSETSLLQAFREEAMEEAKMLSSRQQKIQENIVRSQVDSAARQFDLDSDGGLHGAIRMLDVDAFPKDIVRDVLHRYGITVERRHTSPSAGRSFLNAAKTEEGTFRSVEKEGIYDVMVLSTKAVSFMAMAETNALMDRDYDPRTTRVRKIVFGIVKENNRYMLAVTDLEVEQIR